MHIVDNVLNFLVKRGCPPFHGICVAWMKSEVGMSSFRIHIVWMIHCPNYGGIFLQYLSRYYVI